MPRTARRSRRSLRFLITGVFAAAFTALLVNVATAQLPIAKLDTVFPAGATMGTTVDVQVTGGDLDDATRLLFSHPGIQAKPKMLPADDLHDKPRPKPNAFEVTVAKNVPPGVYEVRVVGRYGISNPRIFSVNKYPEILKTGTPNAPDKAIEVKVGSTINAQATNQEIDYYAINLKQGQKVVFDCWGQRIDSHIEATMKLFGPGGELIKRARNVTRSDPVISVAAPKTGRYVLAVYDFVYRGGADYSYRLTIAARPHIDFIYPPVGMAGSKQKYQVYGRNLPGGVPSGQKIDGVELEEATVEFTLPAGDAVNRLPFIPGLPPMSGLLSGQSIRVGDSDSVLLQYASAPVVLEEESQQSGPEFAQKVQTPCEFVGRMYPRQDVDWIAFEAKKGQTFWLSLLSSRLGTYADPVLHIERVTTDSKGKEQVSKVTTLDDNTNNTRRRGRSKIPKVIYTDSDDPTYRLVADQDCTYRVRVNDLYGNPTSDPRLVYRLIIQLAKPDFEVVGYVRPHLNERNQPTHGGAVLRLGGCTAMKLKIFRRRGYQGKVTVSATGLPAGLTASDAVIEGDVDTGWIVFTAADNAKAWAGPVRLFAKGVLEGKPVTRDVRVATVVWEPSGNSGGHSRMAADFALAVMDAEKSPLTIKAGDGKPLETALGGTLEIPVTIVKREKLKGAVKVEAPAMFQNLVITATNVSGDKGKVKLEVRGNDVPAGTYTFYLRGETKFNYGRNQDAVKATEELQKKATALVNKRKQEESKAQQTKNQATTAAQAAATALKTAEQNVVTSRQKADQAAKQLQAAQKKVADAKQAAAKDPKNKPALVQAEKELKAAQDANQKAAAALKAAQTAATDAKKKDDAAKKVATDADAAAKAATTKRTQAEQLKRQVDTDLNNIKRANPKKDVTVRVVSTPIQLRIAERPYEASVKPPAQKLKPGASIDVPVNVKRFFKFADQISVSVTLAGGSGVRTQQKDIAKGQNGTTIKLIADKNAKPGKYTATVRFRSRLGRVSHDFNETFEFEVVK